MAGRSQRSGPRPRENRDPGLSLAIAAAGGVGALAERMGLPGGRSKARLPWARCPAERVLAMARASGVEAERIRPDLGAWIERERERDRAARFARWAIRPGKAGEGAASEAAGEQALLVMDRGVVAEAMAFAGAQRGVATYAVWRGDSRAALSAWSLGLALAVIVGGVSSSVVGDTCGVSRQAVDNACARYLRARDGDDDDDVVGQGAKGHALVIERGRERRAKTGDEGLWAAEQAFKGRLEGRS